MSQSINLNLTEWQISPKFIGLCRTIIKKIETDIEYLEDCIGLAYSNNHGAFEYCIFEFSIDPKTSIASYALSTGEATFALIPAKTIIVEQRSTSSFFGLIHESESNTTVYEHPISLEAIRDII